MPERPIEPLFSSAMRDALAQYLEAKGLAESQRGYGHATGEDVADAVLVFLSEWTAGQATHG